MPPFMRAPPLSPTQPHTVSPHWCREPSHDSELLDKHKLQAALVQLTSSLQTSLKTILKEQERTFAQRSQEISGIIIDWQARSQLQLIGPIGPNTPNGELQEQSDNHVTPSVADCQAMSRGMRPSHSDSNCEDDPSKSKPISKVSFTVAIDDRATDQDTVLSPQDVETSELDLDRSINGSECPPTTPQNGKHRSVRGFTGLSVQKSRSGSKQLVKAGATTIFEEKFKEVAKIIDSGRISRIGVGVQGMTWAQPLQEESCIVQFTQAWYFTLFVALIIVANSLIIGIQTNYETSLLMDRVTGRPEESWGFALGKTGEGIFAGLFTFELALRFYAERVRFLIGPTWKWNWFDIILVLSANLELIFSGLGNLSFARTLRILRMVRVLQVLRLLRVFDVLRQMVFAILNSFMSMVWIVVLIWLWMYVFGIYFLSSVSSHVEWVVEEQQKGKLTQGYEIAFLDEYFGTLPQSMLTLFQAVTGGKNWGEVLQPLSVISDLNVVVFVSFYIFIVLGVMNIVTGIFVEKATEIAECDRELRIIQRMEQDDLFTKDMRVFFAEVDTDCSGTLDWEEFSAHMEDKRVKAYFEALGLDAGNARFLFDLLDRHGTGYVGIDDFLNGCARMKGSAKSMDMMQLQIETKRVCKMLEILMGYVEDQLEHMVSVTRASSYSRAASTDSNGSAQAQVVPSISDRILQLQRQSSERSFHRLSHCIEWPVRSATSFAKSHLS